MDCWLGRLWGFVYIIEIQEIMEKEGMVQQFLDGTDDIQA